MHFTQETPQLIRQALGDLIQIVPCHVSVGASEQRRCDVMYYKQPQLSRQQNGERLDGAASWFVIKPLKSRTLKNKERYNRFLRSHMNAASVIVSK